MNICIPITSRTTSAALSDLRSSEQHADMTELRIDMMPSVDIPRLIRAARKPVIVTNRKQSEGGKFKGSEKERVARLLQVLEAHPAFVDIEFSTPLALRNSLKRNTPRTRIILSFHDMKKTPSLSALRTLAARMLRTKPFAIKIVTRSKNADDNARVMELIRAFPGNRISAFCLGDSGKPTRIVSLMQGGWMTYMALSANKRSADGQILIGTLLAGVIGNPARHSLSPVIHTAGFRALGMNAIYLPLEISDDSMAIPTMKKLNIRMLSVTTPFKQSIMRRLDRIDPVARTIGAVNTVINRNGVCTGYNTDGIGMLRALGAVRRKKIALFGAGGAARSICFTLTEAGAEVTMYNRTLSKAKKIAREFEVAAKRIDQFDGDADIVINATTVSPVRRNLLSRDMVVADAVYSPLQTKLIKDAKAKGCTTITGDRMLLYQGLEQFKLMIGKRAPQAAMQRALSTSLKNR